MQCMKCGRKTAPNQVFCSECLANMEKAPVKPGTPVTIHKRPQRTPALSVKKEKPEEVILKLHRQIYGLTILIFALFITLVFSVSAIVYHYSTTEHNGFAIGQNYSAESSDGALPIR